MTNFLKFINNNIVLKKHRSFIKFYSFRKFSFTRYFNFITSIYFKYIKSLFHIINYTKTNFIINIYNLFSFYTNTNLSKLRYSLRMYMFDLSFFFIPKNIFSMIMYNINNNIYYLNSSSLFKFVTSTYYLYFLKFYILNINKLGIVSFPKTKKLFTLLRSPHTDKKSREQFSLIVHSKGFSDHINFYFILYSIIKKLSFNSLFTICKNHSFYSK